MYVCMYICVCMYVCMSRYVCYVCIPDRVQGVHELCMISYNTGEAASSLYAI